MSKAILVLDEMPETCADCKLAQDGFKCILSGKTIPDMSSKFDDCLLKEMPKPLSGEEDFPDHDLYEIYGWNNCIKAIEGENAWED